MIPGFFLSFQKRLEIKILYFQKNEYKQHQHTLKLKFNYCILQSTFKNYYLIIKSLLMIKSNRLKIIYSFSFIFFINISACCIFKTDNPDLRIVGQNFPSSVGVGQTFHPAFTVGNYSDGECDAATTTQSIATLRMVNRATGFL